MRGIELLSIVVLFALFSSEPQAAPATGHDGVAHCTPGTATTTLLSGLAQDGWATIGPDTAMQRWSGLHPIGHDADTGRAVLFERGVSEPSGEPRCAERYYFAPHPGRAELGLNEVQVIHQETERATAVELARAWVDATVPKHPRPGSSGRAPLHGSETGVPEFSADHEWVRPQDAVDGDARETVIVDVRGWRGVWRIVFRWSRRFR